MPYQDVHMITYITVIFSKISKFNWQTLNSNISKKWIINYHHHHGDSTHDILVKALMDIFQGWIYMNILSSSMDMGSNPRIPTLNSL